MKYLVLALLIGLFGCQSSSDGKMGQEQEELMQEGVAQAGIPTITNFRERKLMKLLFELRDTEVSTFTYLFSSMQGKYVFLGNSIGYGLPATAQYTNPQRWVSNSLSLPQADPNGLFMPTSAEGTWIMMAGPKGPAPVYVEERILVLPFPLPEHMVIK